MGKQMQQFLLVDLGLYHSVLLMFTNCVSITKWTGSVFIVKAELVAAVRSFDLQE